MKLGKDAVDKDILHIVTYFVGEGQGPKCYSGTAVFLYLRINDRKYSAKCLTKTKLVN